jgi:8-hydroxy-5-deazaflavin:NADPH oxidoreductase
MDISILGTGNVGATLGRRWANAGHQITFGSRKPSSERVRALVAENTHAHQADSIFDAAARGQVIVLATPYGSIEETLAAAGNLTGKVLVDCSNPLNHSFDGLVLGFDDSAAEHVSRLSPGAHVVKAFNTASVATMQNPNYEGLAATMFYCGDDGQAKLVVRGLINDLGMEPIDSGPLKNARFLEPMAMLYIHLAVQQGWGGNCALKMLKREK